MKTRSILIAAAGLLLLPALARADIPNRSPVGFGKADMSLRKLIVKKLNQMPGQQVGRGPKATFLPKAGLSATKSMHPGVNGTRIMVEFQAQPTMKMKIDGRKRSVRLGGCAGNGSVERPIQGADQLMRIDITALLRSGPPGRP